MAKIIVNDEVQEVTLPLNLSELIKLNRVFQPEMVTVQINEEFVERGIVRYIKKSLLKVVDYIDTLISRTRK